MCVHMVDVWSQCDFCLSTNSSSSCQANQFSGLGGGPIEVHSGLSGSLIEIKFWLRQ